MPVAESNKRGSEPFPSSRASRTSRKESSGLARLLISGLFHLEIPVLVSNLDSCRFLARMVQAVDHQSCLDPTNLASLRRELIDAGYGYGDADEYERMRSKEFPMLSGEC